MRLPPTPEGMGFCLVNGMKTLLLLLIFLTPLHAQVKVGSEGLDPYASIFRQKRVGLITNHTAVDSKMQLTVDVLKEFATKHNFTLAALFAPEHGIYGGTHAEKEVKDSSHEGIPIVSLYGSGSLKRLTPEMLKNIDILVYDIQDIGSRSYTYATTLFHAMEAAAKSGAHMIVLDRPNPINGTTVDGPMLEPKWRSSVGYINVPYCHGMTIGELAHFFNGEYKIGCRLTIVPMEGWKREMSFADTGLAWVPSSPQMPEATTPLYYPTTGILGELQLVNIGIGYTLPFKVVGAPWINADALAQNLNKQNFPGVYFKPFHYRPFFGRFAHVDCQGVLICINDPKIFKPVTTQYLIIGIIKSLYPKQFKEALEASAGRKEMFCKVNGTEEVYRLVKDVKHIVFPLKAVHEKERLAFLELRKQYLLYK